MISIVVHDPAGRMPEIAAKSRYVTMDRFLTELARDAKRLGFTHLSPVVYDKRNGRLSQHVTAAKAAGLRLVPWLVPGLLETPLVKPMSAASMTEAAWLIKDYFEDSGALALMDGLVVEDDGGTDNAEKAARRVALAKALPGVPLMVCLGAAYANQSTTYLASVQEPRPVVVPQVYPLWHPGLIRADGSVDEDRVINDVVTALNPLTREDGVCWQGFGMGWAVQDANGNTNWHNAPRRGIDLLHWMTVAHSHGVVMQFIFSALYADYQGFPWSGFWRHDALMSGLTFAQSRAAWALDVRDFARGAT